MNLRLGVIGCGLKAADYAQAWVGSDVSPEVLALTDPVPANIERYASIGHAVGSPQARVYADAETLLSAEAGKLDAVYISTPHAFHARFAKAALHAGFDVLLEKPMALTTVEAQEIIAARDATEGTVVVAYQSSLSPLIRRIRDRIEAQEFGALVTVSGEVWEGWRDRYRGNWKQVPALSGGGFLFDTGSHLMNAVISVTGRRFDCVAAHIRTLGSEIDLVGTAMGTLEQDVPYTLAFCGDTIPGCESALTLYFENAILRVDVWGKWSEIRTSAATEREAAPEEDKVSVLRIFDEVRRGRLTNPSPPERSLHLSEFWDSIKRSSDTAGRCIELKTRP